MIGPSEQLHLLSHEEIAANEFRKYEAEDSEPLERQELLKWWKTREHQLKYLSRVVKRVFCITASSVPSERLFSSAGNLVNEKRSCLSPENVDCLFFVREHETLIFVYHSFVVNSEFMCTIVSIYCNT